MGGNLAWTIRLEDDTQYRMDRWTNTIPALLLDPAFLAGEPQAIAAALEEWLLMQADWDAHKDTEAFTYPMTPVYAPYPFGLQPSEYGLVVVDFQTKTILSLQNYTSFDRLNPVRQLYGPNAERMFPEKVEQMAALAAAGRLDGFEFLITHPDALAPFAKQGWPISPDGPGEWMVRIPANVDINTVNDVCDTARRCAKGQTIAMGWAKVNLAPFTFAEFPSTHQGYRALRDHVLSLGFALSDAEEAVWKSRTHR